MKRPKLKIIFIKEAKETHLNVPENILNKVIEEKMSNLKKEMSIQVQETYWTPLDQKNIITKTLSSEQRKNTKSFKRKEQSTK